MTAQPATKFVAFRWLDSQASLTPDQWLLLGAIRGHFAETGTVPLVREIAETLRLDVDRAAGELRKLVRLGYVRSESPRVRGRSYSLVKKGSDR